MKPILLNYEMVKAVLEERKTQTRRVIKPQPKHIQDYKMGRCNVFEVSDTGNFDKDVSFIETPYPKGGILWVRETWAYMNWNYYYRADMENPTGHYKTKWCPSIHMPKDAARIFLRIKNVRVERIQNITEEDAKAEGIKSYWAEPYRDVAPFIGAAKELGDDLCLTKREAFQQLWDSVVKKSDLDIYGWEANPWVWVIEFERIGGEVR